MPAAAPLFEHSGSSSGQLDNLSAFPVSPFPRFPAFLSVIIATAHDATAHDATAHDATAHDATAHDATAHDATAHDATAHDATAHDATAPILAPTTARTTDALGAGASAPASRPWCAPKA